MIPYRSRKAFTSAWVMPRKSLKRSAPLEMTTRMVPWVVTVVPSSDITGSVSFSATKMRPSATVSLYS